MINYIAKKTSKYKAKKINVDWIDFDSKAESLYYIHCKEMKKNGVIEDFKLQPKFLLQEKFEKDGKNHRAINYIADFLLKYPSWEIKVIDVKWMPTQMAKIKRKMFDYKYRNITLSWVVLYKWEFYSYEENEKRKRNNRKNK